MDSICIIIIAILIVVAISIVQNSKSTFVSTFEIEVKKILSIKFSKKEKRSDKAQQSHPNAPKK
ncbi:MAG: hypothetical protein PHN69_08425 [Candidatus Pacebacteria bacterium]|nr:hypothetical protein [Candidatus Paceibacterota bacterium]